MLPPRVTRRQFLRTSAAVGAATFAAPAFVRARSANEKLNVAVIGPGNHGALNLAATGKLENVFAICDIDEGMLGAAAQQYPSAKTYFDYRKMLDELEKSIDAVVVSTPDHSHAPASAMAMRMGKHCYCEKPLAHTVYEARTLARIAKEKGVATQMGTQMHACDNYRRVVELIQAGAIGPVTDVLLWLDKSWGSGAMPNETQEPPPQIHWNEWLGPASFRPYHPCYLPRSWRCFWDFGNGTFGDMSAHIMDLPFWALDLRYPTTIEAEGPPVDAVGTARSLLVRYEYAARPNMPAVRMTWCDGDYRPAIPQGVVIPKDGIGALFIGKDGMLWANYEQWKLYPEEKFKDFQPPAPTIPTSLGHHKEFFEACKTGGPTTCNFGYSGALSEAILLGTVAYRVGLKLQWDPVNLKATNCAQADRYLRPCYREGWTL